MDMKAKGSPAPIIVGWSHLTGPRAVGLSTSLVHWPPDPIFDGEHACCGIIMGKCTPETYYIPYTKDYY